MDDSNIFCWRHHDDTTKTKFHVHCHSISFNKLVAQSPTLTGWECASPYWDGDTACLYRHRERLIIMLTHCEQCDS